MTFTPGYVLIAPSSVSTTGGSSSISSAGEITVTGATNANINDVFSSSYNAYLILLSGTGSAAQNLIIRYLVGGVAATGSSYNNQRIDLGSSLGTSAGTTTQTQVGILTTDQTGVMIRVWNPAAASNTSSWGKSIDNDGGARAQYNAGVHSVATAYDGFQIYLSGGGSMTFKMCVYAVSH